MSTPRVYVILVNFRGWEDTIECLESLFRMDYDDFRVLVVDNDSGNGSLEKLRSWAIGAQGDGYSPFYSWEGMKYRPIPKPIPVGLHEYGRDGDRPRPGNEHARLILIDAGRNGGYAAGNNIGLRYALADPLARYFWILNHDTVVDPGALRHLCTRLEKNPGAGMCGSKLYYFGSNGQIQALGGSRYNKWFGWNRYVTLPHPTESDLNPEAVESQLTNISGASMLVSRGFVETVGGMCEDYFLYFEELDWFLRAKGRYRLAYAPRSIVYHKHGASLGGDIKPGRRSLFSEYYLQKNKLTFTRKFFPLALPSVYLGLLLAAGNSIIGREWQRFSMITKIVLGVDRPPRAQQ